MLFYPIEISQTASGGAWSFNSLDISGGEIEQIYVEASNGALDATPTTFDFYITDSKGNVIYDTQQKGIPATGTLNTANEVEFKPIPVMGILTLTVANSSVATETFTGRVMVKETKN